MSPMSDEENAALAIKTGIEQFFAPLQRLVDQLLGPAATEVGLTLGDSVKVWRFKRQLRLLQEVQRLIADSGKDIKPVAPRLFFPILEAASIEDDDEMQTRWAALLASEATAVGSVHPSYIDILRQLTPEDAQLLETLCTMCRLKNGRRRILPTGNKATDFVMASILEKRKDSLQSLVRLGLVLADYEMADPEFRVNLVGDYALAPPPELKSWYELSDFAVRFVRACRAPARDAGKISVKAPRE